MKAFKKMAAVIAAATMAVGAMAVSSFAEGEAYKLYVKAEAASVGDIVPVSIAVDSNKEIGVGGISFKINYNPEELELQVDTVKAGEALKDWSGSINTKNEGIVGFAYTLEGDGIRDTGVEILSMSFKVLKVNGKITFTDVDVAADDEDGADLTDKTAVSEATVKCSHKNTETKTEIEDCEKGGKTITTCKDCGETVKTEDIAPSEHKVDEWKETKKATCTEEGEEEGVCTVCGKTVTRKTDMIDHSFGEWKETTAPICTQKGEETRECTVCCKTETREVEALGHDFGEWKVVKEATCAEKGTEERACSRCDEKETREIDMIDHDFEWTVDEEATCTESGSRTGVCKVCGEEKTEITPVLGHDWGEWKVVEEPTTEKEGTEERECSRCGEKETRAIDKLAPVESEATTSPEAAVTTPSGNGGSGDNNGSGNDGNGSGNPITGVALAIIPLGAASAAAIVFSKKRK